ncbi:hypothetical protein ACQQCD_12400 [Pseudarthrobacter sp. J1763]|uniref:hypothetical protein n=1 Tax=Pseudarthrobacter sp. J1763 TaxID=3420445 RepID=UPI003D2804B9
MNEDDSPGAHYSVNGRRYGGSHVRIEDLRRSAAAFRESADLLDYRSMAIRQHGNRLRYSSNAWGMGVGLDLGLGVVGGLAAADEAGQKLVRLGSTLREMAREADSSATRYQEADALAVSQPGIGLAAQGLVAGVPSITVAALGPVGGYVWDWAGKASGLTGVERFTWMLSLGALLTGAFRAGALAYKSSDLPVDDDTTGLGTLGSAFAGVQRAAGDLPLSDASTPEAGVGNKVESTAPNSSIIVEKIPRKDGTYAVIVSIPGTQGELLPDTYGVHDWEGNIVGMSRGRAMAQVLVERALQEQGVTPEDHVILNGHSQGGIHAMALAADPEFMAKFHVEAVNVAGSPVARFHVPQTVSVLAIENTDDIVPSTDGLANPVTPNFTTVTTDRYPGRSLDNEGARLKTIQNAHNLDNYVSGAKVLDTSTDPAIVEHRKVMNSILGPDVLAAPDNADAENERTGVAAGGLVAGGALIAGAAAGATVGGTYGRGNGPDVDGRGPVARRRTRTIYTGRDRGHMG